MNKISEQIDNTIKDIALPSVLPANLKRKIQDWLIME